MDDQTVDDYRTLKINPGVSTEELKKAYHEILQVWHPDRFAHDAALAAKAEEKTKRIVLAYGRLKGVVPESTLYSSHITSEGGTSTEASDRVDADYYYTLATNYISASSESQNLVEAVKCFSLAAVEEHIDAQYALGQCFLNGAGIKKNILTAYDWFVEAAQRGDCRAQYKLGKMYVNGSYNREGLDSLAEIISNIWRGGIPWLGGFVLGSPARIINRWRRSYREGFFYKELRYNGGRNNLTGIATNFAKAYKWMNLAADQGYEDAGRLLIIFEKIMPRENIREGKDLAKSFVRKPASTACSVK